MDKQHNKAFAELLDRAMESMTEPEKDAFVERLKAASIGLQAAIAEVNETNYMTVFRKVEGLVAPFCGMELATAQSA